MFQSLPSPCRGFPIPAARRLALISTLCLATAIAPQAARAAIPAPDQLTDAPLAWSSAQSVISLDYAFATAGTSSIRCENAGNTFALLSPGTFNANWDLAGANVAALEFDLKAFRTNATNAFVPGSLSLQLYTTTGLVQLTAVGDPASGAWAGTVPLAVPLAGSAAWTRTDVGAPNLSAVTAVALSGTTSLAGTIVWIDALEFAAAVTPPPGFTDNVHWSGPGGDVWNTNSSPEIVDTADPFAVLWTTTPQEGHLHRPSGVVLADVGEAATPYLFGSTGWYQNRPYRQLASTGAATSWTAQNGTNDSGTGFRIALSLDGSKLFHIDSGNIVRAYPTGGNPAGTPLWSTAGGNSGLTGAVKVGPDGLLYGGTGQWEYGDLLQALDPETGQPAWANVSYTVSALYPGAFSWIDGKLLYIVAGSLYVTAYDVGAGNDAPPAWSYYDALNSRSAPTVDPATGNVYVFRGSRLVKLGTSGTRLWQSPLVGAGETGCSYGALSRDGQTYYFQTGTETNGGKLYAFRTSNGTIKWSYPTGARVRYDGGVGGPIVSANGVVFVANGAHSIYPGDNRLYCIEDSAGVAPVLRGSFDLNDGGDAGGPWLSLGPGGVLYFDAWAAPDNPALFACQSNPSLVIPPVQQRALALDGSVRVRWQPLAKPGAAFSRYVVYRDTQPFTTVAGLAPVGEVTDPGAGEFVDHTAANGQSYWYAVTARSTTGGQIDDVEGIGPRTPRAESDYQVVTVSREPRFPRYDPIYTEYQLTDAAGYGPYRFRAATSLGSGQTASTPREPTPGETVTYTGVVRNRGTGSGPVTVDMTWTVDGVIAATQQRVVSLAPGDTARCEYAMTWDGLDHEVAFAFTTDVAESRAGNNDLAVTSRSVGFLTYVEESHAEVFREETVDYPQAATDDFIDWLNHHMARLNALFAAAGSPKRVHYEVLSVIDDFAEDPAVDRMSYAIFPFRLRGDEANYRHTGWYSVTDDIDYGLLHEEGHQLGLIDVYQLNMSGDSNLVNGSAYSGPACLMNGCSPFLSAHSAGAMTRWYEPAHGYFGQYLYGIPATVRLRLLGTDGLPLAGAAITVYQRAQQADGQVLITAQPRAQLTSDVGGIVTLPNVAVDPAVVPPLPNGDVLSANPFGYVDMLGTNGIFLVKVQHEGFTDWCWLDITEVNLAYWSGQVDETTIERSLRLGGEVQVTVPSDLAEPVFGEWSVWAEAATASVAWDAERRVFGPYSLRFETTGGFDTLARFPGDRLAMWDLSARSELRFQVYAENPGWGFQGDVPWVRLGCPDGSSFDLRPTSGAVLNLALDQWHEFVVPLAGDAEWQLSTTGAPSLAAVSSLEIHMDTWDYGFTAWIDGVRFTPIGSAALAPAVSAVAFGLGGNTPNPFNPSTVIRYGLDREGPVTLRVYNARGELVRTLVDGPQAAGPQVATWDGRDNQGREAGAGAYLCALESQGRRASRKIMLVK